MSGKTQFLSFLISDLIHLCCSHPLYLFYFIFFSPYLFKTLCFLSPLLVTSSFLLSIVSVLSKKELCVENEGCLEDLGMYEILFGSCTVEEEKLVKQKCVLEEKRLENLLDQLKGTPVVHEKMKIGSEECLVTNTKAKANVVDQKEKEWERTLACKLFEERHNVGGMDSLWEAYEMKANKPLKKKTKRGEVDDDQGPLCCLQAIKLSMNLGMGRKFTKAIKGIGWLHKQSKKVHNNGDR